MTTKTICASAIRPGLKILTSRGLVEVARVSGTLGKTVAVTSTDGRRVRIAASKRVEVVLSDRPLTLVDAITELTAGHPSAVLFAPVRLNAEQTKLIQDEYGVSEALAWAAGRPGTYAVDRDLVRVVVDGELGDAVLRLVPGLAWIDGRAVKVAA
jgi:hypothetical protein